MYNIWFIQKDKNTGEIVGKGKSVKSYYTKEKAMQDLDEFEFDEENFKQEVIGVFKNEPTSHSSSGIII